MWCVLGMTAFLVCPLTEMPELPTEILNIPTPYIGEKEASRPPSKTTEKKQSGAHNPNGSEQFPFFVRVLDPPKTEPHAAQPEKNSLAEPRKDFFGPEWSVGWVTGALVFVGACQLALFVWQLRIMRVGMEDARLAAKAAMKSAEAALAALDRAWIVIEQLRYDPEDWEVAWGELTATLRIANYGKAPAFLSRFKAVVFQSAGPGGEKDFPVKPIPSPIRAFPAPGEVGEFLRKWGGNPMRNVEDDPDIAIKPADESGKPFFSVGTLDAEIAVPGGEKTSLYFFRGTRRGPAAEGAIPLERAAQVFLIGTVLYSTPGQGFEEIRFCYRGTQAGGFEPMLGAPYNERRRVSDFPQAEDAEKT